MRIGKKGFTLIELLVVIAIIGILSSVVIASLNTARNKGKYSAIKSGLNTARTEAEIYYTSNSNSYSGVCDPDNSNSIGEIAMGLLSNITDTSPGYKAAYGSMSDGPSPYTRYANGASNVIACHERDSHWLVLSGIPGEKGFAAGTEGYCVDSFGFVGEVDIGLVNHVGTYGHANISCEGHSY